MKKSLITLISILCLNLNSGMAFDLADAVLSNNRPASIPEYVSSNDGVSYYRMDESNKIVKVGYKTGKIVTTIFDSSTARNCNVNKWDGFEISEDETKILLYTNSEPIYRHSFKAEYYIFEIKRNNVKPLTSKGAVEIARFSPDARMVAFVFENNIYLKKLDYDTEVQVTTDGVVGEIINGVPDWVYQEEFSMLSSLVFSQDNTILSYLKWDERNVGKYDMTLYQGSCNPNDKYSLYPGCYSYKYPFAGTNNSIVSIHCYDIDTRKTKSITLPDDAYYIANIQQGNSSDKLISMTLNREQNELKFYTINPRSTVSKLIYTDKSQTWIDINEIIPMTKFYSDFFITASSRSGNNHLYKYGNTGNMISQITKGEWEVTDFYGFDPITKSYYFQTTEDGPINRTISKINQKGIQSRVSSKIGWNSALFNQNFSYFILNYSDALTPNQYTIYDTKRKVRDLELNETYAQLFTSSAVPRKEFFKFEMDGNSYNGYMIKPLSFSTNLKYPVILSQYSGPGSQMVKNSWKMDWEQYAATQGYIIVCVDGRGTGGRGSDWESIVYMQLGKYESIDQINAAKYISSLPYVDKSKIGIYGWSYGGYETLMAMSHPESNFKAGVAIAPVTDWRFYDSIYTERYMRTPQQNKSGYDSASAINAINNLNGRLLIISGTADDNVHITNTYQYVSNLTSQNKICDMMIYPNMNHSINGCDVRYILYKKVLDFFDTHLK